MRRDIIEIDVDLTYIDEELEVASRIEDDWRRQVAVARIVARKTYLGQERQRAIHELERVEGTPGPVSGGALSALHRSGVSDTPQADDDGNNQPPARSTTRDWYEPYDCLCRKHAVDPDCPKHSGLA